MALCIMETGRLGAEVAGEQTNGAGSEHCCMRILVVEDDKKIASFVIKGLKQSGYAVDASLA